MPLPQKHFYMIRHGQTEANLAQVMAGSTDSPLTALGREQAKGVQDIVRNLAIKPTAIVHSNLSRARDTASIINEALGVPMHEEADVAEICAGDWEGKPWHECAELLDGWPTPPNGESFEEFCTRIRRGKKRHLEQHDGPILIVCHGGVFRAMGGLYGLNTPGIFRNCHLHEFHPSPESQNFPWAVSHYDYENRVIKEKTNVFHDSQPYDAD